MADPAFQGIRGSAAISQVSVDAVTLGKARANIHDFVTRERKAGMFNADWTTPYWPVPARSRGSRFSDGGIWFTIEPATKRVGGTPFPQPFMSFAMAMLSAYERQKAGGYSVSGLQALVSALRFLYAALEPKNYDPARLTHADFEQAIHDARQTMRGGSRNVGSRLAFIARKIDSKLLSGQPIQWKNSLGDTAKYDAVGPEADRRRIERMPANDVLRGLARIASAAKTPGSSFFLHDRDLIVMRAVELLLCCGFRINELLTLPVDPLVRKPVVDEFGNQRLDARGQPATTLELRYWPEKGGHREVRLKPVPDVMRDIVERAIDEITCITAPARRIAVFQQKHPGRTLLQNPWHKMPGTALISLSDMSRIIGFGNLRSTERELTAAAQQFARNQCVQKHSLARKGAAKGAKVTFVRKCDLETALYRRSTQGNMLRKDEGSQDISKCLFTIRSRLLRRDTEGGLSGTVCLLTDKQVLTWLCGQPAQPSIFERFSLLDAEGKPLKVNTHAFRHWTNTIAVEGGLSPMMLASMRGSTSLSQNQAYNHLPGFERALRVRDKLMLGEASGPLADAVLEVNDPIERATLISTHARTALLTDFGACLHDWDALPCPKHGACSDCDQHWVIKGELRTLENIRQLHADTLQAVTVAEAVHRDHVYGANRWLAAHQRTLHRVTTMLAIHADKTIPDGTLVQLWADGTYDIVAKEKREKQNGNRNAY